MLTKSRENRVEIGRSSHRGCFVDGSDTGVKIDRVDQTRREQVDGRSQVERVLLLRAVFAGPL